MLFFCATTQACFNSWKDALCDLYKSQPADGDQIVEKYNRAWGLVIFAQHTGVKDPLLLEAYATYTTLVGAMHQMAQQVQQREIDSGADLQNLAKSEAGIKYAVAVEKYQKFSKKFLAAPSRALPALQHTDDPHLHDDA